MLLVRAVRAWLGSAVACVALLAAWVAAFHGALFRRDLGRTNAVFLGAALAPIAYLAVAWQVREYEDPQTVAAWLVYLTGHIQEAAIGILPFVLAGAVFGSLWSGRLHVLVEALSTQKNGRP